MKEGILFFDRAVNILQAAATAVATVEGMEAQLRLEEVCYMPFGFIF